MEPLSVQGQDSSESQVQVQGYLDLFSLFPEGILSWLKTEWWTRWTLNLIQQDLYVLR